MPRNGEKESASSNRGSKLERLCAEKGLKMTGQRRIVAAVLSESDDHPSVEQVYERAAERDPRISLATVYRTVKLFEELEILDRHDFGDGRARYEERSGEHHDHLIDLDSGAVIEFCSAEIEQLQKSVAARLGYHLVGHRLELYGVRISGERPGPETGRPAAAGDDD
jgi:Fur family ferric uptake transcriptional regulator